MIVLKEFVCLSIFIILSTLFAMLMVIAGFLLQYKKTSKIKNSTYECGLKSESDTEVKFDIKYFNYAVVFLIFDVETVFLYPFALFCDALGLFAIVEAFIFVGMLVFGLVFGINKKVLRWI